jgi:hypothetical protein
MRFFFAIPALFLAAFSLRQSATPTKPSPAFSIKVAPPSAPIRLGQPATILVTVTNISDKAIYLDSTRTTSDVGMYRDFQYLLTRNGQEVETTFFNRKLTGRQRPDDPQEVWAGSTILLPHPPGKIWDMKIDLKRLYEITQPGEYTVSVSRFDDSSKTTVHSNTLTLKIAP